MKGGVGRGRDIWKRSRVDATLSLEELEEGGGTVQMAEILCLCMKFSKLRIKSREL